MNFHEHSNLSGTHAVFGASQNSWLNYDENKIIDRYLASYAPKLGTVLHEYARQRITHSLKMSKYDAFAVVNFLLENKIPKAMINIEAILDTLVPYVNDAIKYRMTPELILYYSDYFYGTTDCVAFNEKSRTLRIHDYKSGAVPAKMEQLDIYAALFCLEYGFNPDAINIELRIYQSGDILVHNPEANEIEEVMNKIKVDNFVLIDFIKGEN